MPVSVKFYLESKTKGGDDKLLPIFLYIRHRAKTIKTYTERKCTRYAWDTKKGRAVSRRFRAATELNGYLSAIEEDVANLFNYNLRKSVSTRKADIDAIILRMNGGESKKELTLLSFANDFLSKTKLAKTTLKGYQTTLNTLSDYSSKKKKQLRFDDIDLSFYDDFTSWMWKEKNFNDNTVGTRIKHLKALMSQAFERDLHTNLNFKKKKFQVLKKEVDSIYLRQDELDKINSLDLTGNTRLQRVRDAFMVACWTGLRFSDLKRVTREKFIVEDGMYLFKIESEKTGEIVKIPLAPAVNLILEKYSYQLPVNSNQKMNEYLKELGEKAGLSDQIELSDVKAGKKIRTKYFKYDLITTHTARRSFASNLYLQGVPSRSIMAITGHRTEAAFLSYIKLSHMEKIREVAAHFKKTALELKPAI